MAILPCNHIATELHNQRATWLSEIATKGSTNGGRRTPPFVALWLCAVSLCSYVAMWLIDNIFKNYGLIIGILGQLVAPLAMSQERPTINN